MNTAQRSQIEKTLNTHNVIKLNELREWLKIIQDNLEKEDRDVREYIELITQRMYDILLNK
jgi:hypothetical protein